MLEYLKKIINVFTIFYFEINEVHVRNAKHVG